MESRVPNSQAGFNSANKKDAHNVTKGNYLMSMLFQFFSSFLHFFFLSFFFFPTWFDPIWRSTPLCQMFKKITPS